MTADRVIRRRQIDCERCGVATESVVVEGCTHPVLGTRLRVFLCGTCAVMARPLGFLPSEKKGSPVEGQLDRIFGGKKD